MCPLSSNLNKYFNQYLLEVHFIYNSLPSHYGTFEHRCYYIFQNVILTLPMDDIIDGCYHQTFRESQYQDSTYTQGLITKSKNVFSFYIKDFTSPMKIKEKLDTIRLLGH